MTIILAIREVLAAKVGIALFLSAIVIGVVAHNFAVPLKVLVRDPAAEFDFPPYAGFFSHMGISFLVATAAVTFFAAMVAGQFNGRYSIPLLATSLFSIFLAIDDLFMLHELASRFGEVVFFACLGLAMCVILFLLAKNANDHDLRGLYWAIGFLGLSAVADLLKIYGPFAYWLEDFSKLAGLGAWLAFWSGYSKTELLLAKTGQA